VPRVLPAKRDLSLAPAFSGKFLIEVNHWAKVANKTANTLQAQWPRRMGRARRWEETRNSERMPRAKLHFVHAVHKDNKWCVLKSDWLQILWRSESRETCSVRPPRPASEIMSDKREHDKRPFYLSLQRIKLHDPFLQFVIFWFHLNAL